MTLSSNKKAFFDYEVLEKYEAGIVLTGAEVKSCRLGRINLKGSYVKSDGFALFVEKLHIGPYQQNNQKDYNPLRKRKLILKEKELNRISAKLNEKGLTVAPLSVYLKNNLIKVEVGLCKGKKKHDKREAMKKKDLNRRMKRITLRIKN